MPPTQRRRTTKKATPSRAAQVALPPLIDVDFGDLDTGRIRVPVPYLQGGEQHAEEFAAWADPGVGVIGAWVGATETQRQQLALALLARCLVDDDGLSAGYSSPTKTVKNKRVVDRAHPDFDARQDTRARWSSKRRFLDLSGDPVKRVPATALVSVLDAVVRGATGARPTGSSGR